MWKPRFISTVLVSQNWSMQSFKSKPGGAFVATPTKDKKKYQKIFFQNYKVIASATWPTTTILLKPLLLLIIINVILITIITIIITIIIITIIIVPVGKYADENLDSSLQFWCLKIEVCNLLK